jgi:NAD(P)-dependent dehydrogenase (short-subunit alcohol dehydrogenase family)
MVPSRSIDLSGTTAVVTGASRGLGAGLAATFQELGMRLGLCARGAPALSGGERVLTSCLDVTDAVAVDAFTDRVVARFGRIDLWINNAGVLEPIERLRDVTAEAFRHHLDVNVTGVFLGTRAFARHVRSRAGEGVLINISSGAARRPYAGWSAYCAAKAAVDRLTECVALEEADAGLRAHSVAPGVIDTHMQERIRHVDESRFPAVERFRDLKREGTFNTPAFVARELAALAFEPSHRTEEVLIRLEDEWTQRA